MTYIYEHSSGLKYCNNYNIQIITFQTMLSFFFTFTFVFFCFTLPVLKFDKNNNNNIPYLSFSSLLVSGMIKSTDSVALLSEGSGSTIFETRAKIFLSPFPFHRRQFIFPRPICLPLFLHDNADPSSLLTLS